MIRFPWGRPKVTTVSKGPDPLPWGEAAPADVTRLLRLEDEAASAMALTRLRLGLLGLGLGACFALMGARAVGLSLKDWGVVEETVVVAERAAPRGEIWDRNGEILADNLDYHSVYADPRYVWNPGETAQQLASVLPNIDVERLSEQLSSNGRFVWVARGLTPTQRQAIHMLGLAGIHFRVEPGRVYPRGHAASHILGYTDRDMHGIAGAEAAFETALDAGDGRPISLSIDLTAQHAVESVLRERMARYQAEGAAAVLMKVGTGEIIAMVSLPDFDPNRPGDSDPEAVFNRATSGVYEMGSTFKVFNLAMALESGQFHLDDVVDATYPLRIGGFSISDFHPQRRPLTLEEVLIHSSNIGSARVADAIGPQAQREFLQRLRLLERAPVELLESGDPITPERWQRIQTMTISYGHGISVSPLALTAAFAAIANGGVYVPPTLRPVAPGETVVGDPVLSPATSALVLATMRKVVTEGSGRQADVADYAIAGKTGTAERVVNGRYSRSSLRTSFIAIFPFDDPEYVLLTMLDRPKRIAETHGFATAGWNAAPTAGAIIERVGPILNPSRRIADPEARAQTVAAMFAPRAQAPVRPGPEEPLPGDIVRPATYEPSTAGTRPQE
ncbi:peptidoglycan D,D-transpeptidase FtsI family protein [Woodsholea maritima]|uniref:peptidoglycan D,D-transpeptidase FtsI family protein n=1 Tax=Woodsholea maritima TaxID=240237 RepID=UPI00035E7FFE|nr:penicillin-binding protein 2 [Woodsholea maritima]